MESCEEDKSEMGLMVVRVVIRRGDVEEHKLEWCLVSRNLLFNDEPPSHLSYRRWRQEPLKVAVDDTVGSFVCENHCPVRV
jgi:hypothetical protein